MGTNSLCQKAAYHQGRASRKGSRSGSRLRVISLLAIGYKKVVGMAGYPKIWTTLWTSPDFQGLPGTARGVLIQLIIWCKHERDDGLVLAKSYSNLSAQLGFSRQAVTRLIAKLVTECYIELSKTSSGQLMIRLPMYDESQRVTAKEMTKRRRKWTGKVSKSDTLQPTTRPDQTRPDQSTPKEIAPVQNGQREKEKEREEPKMRESSDCEKLDAFRDWKAKEENHEALMTLAEVYESFGGAEWVRSHTLDIEHDIVMNQQKYLGLGGEKWLKWIEEWLKVAAETGDYGNYGQAEPMSEHEEKQHYEYHKVKAGSRGKSKGTAAVMSGNDLGWF
jgi:hypothetical protein